MGLIYAAAPTEETKRRAALAAARHFGTEAVRLTGMAADCGDEAHSMWAFRVVGRHPKWGYDLLDHDHGLAIHVAPDGTVTTAEDGADLPCCC